MNRTKIILCGRKEYERHHRPKGLAGAYKNRKPFVKNLPKPNKGGHGIWLMTMKLITFHLHSRN